MRLLLGLLWISLSSMYTVFGAAPITSLSVTFRGKRYSINEVTSVQDLQEQLEEKSGVSPKQQGRVIFGGKSLAADSTLEEAGVPNDGSASLTVLPSTVSKTKKSKSTTTKKAATKGSALPKEATKSPKFDKVEDMMKKMGGAGMPSMEESMKTMSEAMKNPMVQQMLSDPEKLEQMRKMIQTNPMLKSMMGNMPGFDELLNDPDAFREAMQASADLYKNMDPDSLMNSMMGGAAAASGGLFDGTLDNSASAAALDELDEDD